MRVILVALALALFMAGMAYARPVRSVIHCHPYAALTERLASKYGETQQAAFINGNNFLVELWASEAGTWTFLVKLNEETGCIMSSGQSWSGLLEPALKGQGT